MTDIVIVNQSTVLTDAQVAAVIPALHAQVTDDWLPNWPGQGATIHFAGTGTACRWADYHDWNTKQPQSCRICGTPVYRKV